MTTKTISTTWPWAAGLSVGQVVDRAQALKCSDLCIRAVEGPSLFGVSEEIRTQWGGATHFDLEKAAKEAGLTVSIWCAFSLTDPPREAQAIQEAVLRYRPTAVFLDAEGNRFKTNVPQNLGAFLRLLGRLPSKVYLQSYRFANLHPEMDWRKWYSYRDEQSGEFVIDGLGHQLYPIGKTSVNGWVEDVKGSVRSHDALVQAQGRQMPWYPTLPTFIGTAFEGTPGWQPTPEPFLAAVDWLKENLGERLAGVNFWSLDRMLIQMNELFKAVAKLKLGAAEAPEPEVEDVPLAVWAQKLDEWARVQGYTGPRPKVSV